MTRQGSQLAASFGELFQSAPQLFALPLALRKLFTRFCQLVLQLSNLMIERQHLVIHQRLLLLLMFRLGLPGLLRLLQLLL
ncbi:hypothetical protein D3C78_1556800 [compost metagenome]